MFNVCMHICVRVHVRKHCSQFHVCSTYKYTYNIMLSCMSCVYIYHYVWHYCMCLCTFPCEWLHYTTLYLNYYLLEKIFHEPSDVEWSILCSCTFNLQNLVPFNIPDCRPSTRGCVRTCASAVSVKQVNVMCIYIQYMCVHGAI